MTTLALNNLWTYLQGLALAQSDKEWLANRLILSANTATATSEERKARFFGTGRLMVGNGRGWRVLSDDETSQRGTSRQPSSLMKSSLGLFAVTASSSL